jgi:hypothetical protein
MRPCHGETSLKGLTHVLKLIAGAALLVALSLSAAPVLAQTATEYQNARGGKAVVGGNGQRAGVQTANGNKAYAGPHGAGYNGKNSAAYSGRNSSGSYNKTNGQYQVNTANKTCTGTKDSHGNCVTK